MKKTSLQKLAILTFLLPWIAMAGEDSCINDTYECDLAISDKAPMKVEVPRCPSYPVTIVTGSGDFVQLSMDDGGVINGKLAIHGLAPSPIRFTPPEPYVQSLVSPEHGSAVFRCSSKPGASLSTTLRYDGDHGISDGIHP